MEAYSAYKDAGTKRPDYSGDDSKPMLKKPQKMKIEHERITVDSDDFPYLQSLTVGESCELKVKIKKVGEKISEGVNKYEGNDKRKEAQITLEIEKISEPQSSSAPYKNLIKEGVKGMK